MHHILILRERLPRGKNFEENNCKTVKVGTKKKGFDGRAYLPVVTF